MRDGLLDLLLARLLAVEVPLEEHVVGLRHGLDQPRAQLLRVREELLGDVFLDEPAELAILPPRIGVRAHADQIDDAGERVAQPEGQLQRHRPGLERLLDVVERAQEARPVLVQLVHAGDDRERPLRRHLPVRFGLVLDAAHRRHQQKAAVAHRQRPVGVGEEVGEAGRVEQVHVHALVLGVGHVGGHGEVALGLLRVDVEVAGRAVLAGPGRRVVAQERLGERRLSRPVVGDHRHVANLLRIEHGIALVRGKTQRRRIRRV